MEARFGIAAGSRPILTTTRTWAHIAIFEVIYNHPTNSLTDPAQVYELRWIAGKRAGLPEVDPPYTLGE